ncbi:putative membrane protein DUF2306 [Paenibacillus cellulosilyticus]|uniref:Putative membrane protein DUF2306 n=1 Tax=Paenibacillus cellulosilyticus TaxID=375489 RepID=A0A2V2YW82_9BACL|nr:DUF2306 domain-containing protein [Paenibacillus cellulosilyticus]PWW05221.1 putative membrane protein DUF2306 [Paenibacillus cellulosilyticus]QKS43546.1 DUF2306 domain-containing protein [Paenibacillus cellulosilyticus]
MMFTRSAAARKWMFGLLALLAVGIGLYAFAFYGTIDSTHNTPFVESKADASLPDLWYTVLWLHAISAGTALGIGWLQFVKRIRRSSPNVHRLAGYLYSAGITVGGVTGLYVAWYADGGMSGKIGFAALALAWLYTLYRGLKSIYERNYGEHARWLTRNYALTCAAIMLRIYLPVAAGLFGVSDTNDSFIVIAWLCWIPNLLFAEMINSGRRPARRRPVQL